MRRKYNVGGRVPSKFKGFSSLPESVQRKMNTSLAKKYTKGGVMSKDEYDDLVSKLGGQPLPTKLDSLYKGQSLPTNLDSVIKLQGQVLPKSYNDYKSQILPTTNKEKEEGGVLEKEGGGLEKLTKPSDNLTTGVGIGATIGSTIGEMSNDGDATTYKGGEILGDVAKGAAAGAKFGPLGSILGGGAAVVKGLVEKNKAEKEEKLQKEKELKKQKSLIDSNIQSNIDKKEDAEEKERVSKSMAALNDMAPMGSETMTPTPMMKKYGGTVNPSESNTPPKPPAPPGFMYNEEGKLVRKNKKSLDIRLKNGGLLAKKYSRGQMQS